MKSVYFLPGFWGSFMADEYEWRTVKAFTSAAIFGNALEVTAQKCHWKTLPLKAQKAAAADGPDPSLNIKSG